ncbi:MAG: AGE family epimerase/isomerase [Opitutaceae bacterium]|nr:AGE family epimerase/isomerase [Opitutaceae bacterium]
MQRPTQAEATATLRAALAAGRRGETQALAQWLRAHLFGHILPFWQQHGFDPQGGILTCIADDGMVQSTEKWLWSQWRAVWVFARLHNTIDRNPVWLEHARAIAEFCLRHGWRETEQGWALLLAQDGRVLRGNESIYTDGFAVYALAELFRATGEARYRDCACRTADAALNKLQQPYDRLPHFPYPIPAGAKPHGIPMFWSFKLAELGEILGDERYLQAARGFSDEVFRDFYRRDSDRIIEFVRQDGGDFTPPQGTVTVPGHAIEDMWFQLHVFQSTRRAEAPRDLAIRLIRRHLELGWDESHGGLRLAIDRDGRQGDAIGWKFADTKLWWPHTETLYALLLAWHETGDAWFYDWYEKIWALCLERYVDWEHGEWRQKLNRDLTPMTGVVALPVKDPFHLPRAIMLQIELLERSAGQK